MALQHLYLELGEWKIIVVALACVHNFMIEKLLSRIPLELSRDQQQGSEFSSTIGLNKAINIHKCM